MKKYFLDLLKSDNPKAYKDIASQGLLLGYPVKINGSAHRPDNGIKYHSTIKFFNHEKDDPKDVHKIASKMGPHKPHPEEVGITPDKIKSRAGDDIYVIKLHGHHADQIKERHKQFGHMGHKENYEFHPHISVDKQTHDRIKASGAKTAHEAGIEFEHPELKRGPKTMHSYAPKVKKSEESEAPPLTKPYSSEAQRRWAHTETGKKALGGNAGVHEWDEATKGKKLPEKVGKSEDLEKGAVKNMLTGAAMGAALVAPHATDAKQAKMPSRSPASVSAPKQHSDYSQEKMLNAISQVESSGGKNTKHKPTSMGQAYGKFALMPDVVHDTIRLNPDLKRQHSKALNLNGKDLHHYLQDNPKLEQEIANKHLSRLEHHFGQDPNKLSFAWNHGIVGTNRSLKQKQDISSHPYVQKFNAAYKGSK